MENQVKEKKGGMTKQMQLILAAVLLVIIVAVIVVLAGQKKQSPTTQNQPNQEQATATPDVADASTPANDEELTPVEIPNIEGAKVVIEGANAITPDNKVVTETGVVTENVVLPMAPTAPKQTGFLDKAELPKGVVNVNVGNDKFSPAEFSTKVGAPTTFSLTGIDDFSHVIAFDDASLSAIAILVGPGQTKAITFNAPTTAGTYTFSCASPDHAAKGEVGKMIVK
ncbi:MAG: cupredoxin domain-containing protein [Patescibacteria group bacterium]